MGGGELVPAVVTGRPLIGGSATGTLLRLTAPISFWGGVDPRDGRIIDRRHPDHGARLSGRILVLRSTIGSSSSSAVLLELIRNRCAPAALLLGEVDAILILGVIVARELGYQPIPVLGLSPQALDELSTGAEVDIALDGAIRLVGHDAAQQEPG